jgi:hypothetical protein
MASHSRLNITNCAGSLARTLASNGVLGVYSRDVATTSTTPRREQQRLNAPDSLMSNIIVQFFSHHMQL